MHTKSDAAEVLSQNECYANLLTVDSPVAYKHPGIKVRLMSISLGSIRGNSAVRETCRL